MTIKQVLKMGESQLLEVASPVKAFNTSELEMLIQDMKDTMSALSGAGLAAPQIGVGLQVVIFGFKENQRYPDADEIPFTVLINPQLTPLSDEIEEDWEGCLSVPGLRGKVPRYTHLRYQGFDQHGQAIDRQVDGFHARVVQHECDHLQGILYPMRIRDFRSFGFIEALFPEQVVMDE
ncbi:MAG: peptide deformylase [Burkholderiales bacterium]|uniref:peptide deformylase n=1 Tax=Nitrosomonas sp. TaxID=42353 RepID=UPI002843447D|nr:peptide deformylase [Nitrosomonas sp.]MCP5246655.1 peptide deformylase [Burkholderiales bacterium]MDR4515002.1 peptide deformylase [Nitrosomonas sp.]